MKTNKLYPIFIKMDSITTLIVGGGKVAAEKLHFMLKSSPDAQIRLVSKHYSSQVRSLIQGNPAVEVIKSEYVKEHLQGIGLVIAATNSKKINRLIMYDATCDNILVNVADTPDLCQFYLGGIVTKGDLKIAISTNGRSPVLAKRLRGFFEQVIPENLQILLGNLENIRNKVGADLQKKTALLNELTSSYVK